MSRLRLWQSFKEIADRFPERTALEYRDLCLSYKGLYNASVNAADELKEFGIRKSDVIGIHLEGNVCYIILLLGLIRLGAVFMPLNSRFPKKILMNILNKTKPDFIISGTQMDMEYLRIYGESQNMQSSRVLTSEKDEKGCLNIYSVKKMKGNIEEKTNMMKRFLHPSKEDACYIICTSGSTGDPKAILGSEKGLLHFINWEIREFDIDETDRVSLLSPVSFDVSLRDIFLPVLSGGTLVIPGRDVILSPISLREWMNTNKISHTHMVPTLFRLLTSELAKGPVGERSLPSLKRVLLAGEPLYGHDITKWRNIVDVQAVELVNLYGPSETTLAKFFYRIGFNDIFKHNDIIPLGWPLPDTELRIMKENRKCRVKDIGEIHIKTPYRSLGYVGDSKLSRRSFIKDNDGVIYRTGDLGYYGQDGLLYFKRRKDDKVKLYGNPVDLGEIEVAIRRHPMVMQAAVDVRKNKFGDLRLIGYVVTIEGERLSIELLNRFMKDHLPYYMVPTIYIFLSCLPLTHNDKINREALPDPSGDRPELDQTFESPATEIEKSLSGIWCEVLELDRIGALDNFFDLGGSSILAARVITKIQEEMARVIPIVNFYQYPSVRLLAKWLDNEKEDIPIIADIQRRAERYLENRSRKGSEGMR